MLPPILVEMKANSREFVAGMKTAQHEVQKLGTEGSSHMQKFAAVGRAALFGVGAVALTVGGFSVEMADKFEASHAKLVAALKGSGTSFDAWKGQIAAADSRMEKLGFTNAQTQDALGGLVIALQDPAKALKVMATAADLARAKNIDLSTAGTMVARAMEGNSRALKQMGIDLPINAKSAENLKVAQNNLRFATEAYNTQLLRIHEKHKVTAADLATLKTAHDRLTFAQQQVNQAQQAGTLILDALNQRLGGQSQQYTESFAGKVTVLKTQMEDLGVKIGLALIPMLEKAASITETVVNWFERHSTVAKVLAVTIGTLTAAFITLYVAVKTATLLESAATLATRLFGTTAAVTAVETRGLAASQALAGEAAGASALGFARAIPVIGAVAIAAKMASDVTTRGNQKSQDSMIAYATASQANLAVVQKKYADLTQVASHQSGLAKTQMLALLAQMKAAIDAGTAKWNASGAELGQNLGLGIVTGLHASDVPVVTAASGLGRRAIAALKAATRVSSPSKETIYIGQMMAQGLIDGFKGHSLALVDKLGDSLRQLLDKIHTRIVTATQRTTDAVKAAKDKLAQDLQTSGQFAGGIAQNILGGSALSGAFDSSTGVLGSITGYLQSKLTGSQTELSDILGFKGSLNPTTLAELAGMSPDQEMAVAGQLRQPGQVGQVNSLQAQLESTANKIGQAVADATYAKTIATDQKQVADQLKEQKKQTALLEYIAHHLGIDIAKALTSPAGAKALRDALTRLGKTGTNLGLA